MESNKKAYPGKFLGYIYEYSLGDSGVYRKEDKIYASLFGEISIDASFTPQKISVKNEMSEYIPKLGDEVYCKITKVTKNVAMGDIVALKTKAIRIPIVGLIKYENVKNDYKEFDMFECFVPGDIVLCRIISIDQTNYIYLSTQDISYGVIFARSPLSQSIMLPVNLEKMMCLDTHITEKRKVAKPLYI